MAVNLLATMVLISITGAVIQSRRSKSKLAKAMITGRKEISAPDS